MPKFQSAIVDVDDTPQSDEVMPKIQSAVIDLDVDDTTQIGEIKCTEQEASKLSNLKEATPMKSIGKTDEDLQIPNNVPESQIPVDLSNDLDNFTPLKRVSPTEKNKC